MSYMRPMHYKNTLCDIQCNISFKFLDAERQVGSSSNQFRPLTCRNVDFGGSWDLLGSPGGGSGDPLGSSWGALGEALDPEGDFGRDLGGSL